MTATRNITLSPRRPTVLDDQLLEVLPAAVYVCDLDGVVVRYNKKAAELWGRAPIPGDANELYCGSYRLYLPNGDLMPHNQTPMVDAMRSGASFRNIEVQIEQPDGRRIWAMVSIDPLRDNTGAIVGAINCFQDITDHKLAQAQKLQIDELNHRVKNVIGTVLGIARFTFKHTDPLHVEKVLEGRLLALASAHQDIASRDWEGAGLRELVESIAVPFCAGRLEHEGPNVVLGPRLGVSLALTFQELATNALKYGALSRPEGGVRLTWQVTGEEASRELALRWVEATSFAIKAPTRRGFGTSLIEGMLKDSHRAQVKTSFPPHGAQYEIVVPL
ncbi:MAG: PAS domain-containing protein [Methylobacterium sp.]|uniref:HWE histidine kinase domain-containing protein n=1 Tax=Methylobacterium sp. TaxID=409 RepID=UPI002587DFCA|nr:HWE histidine kinase domain-containing protein [Methylobacterium sp.]MBY0298210.1 PAS domain-containing protein [Methylobacterium sp.]